jgi:hypothetical protein
MMRVLWRRGLVFVTTFEVNGEEFFGNVLAATREQAERIAAERGCGEKVLRRSTESAEENGAKLDPLPYRGEAEIASLKRAFLRCGDTEAEAEARARDGWPGRCQDCQCEAGEAHHDGCAWERCPRCGGQLIGCGCR